MKYLLMHQNFEVAEIDIDMDDGRLCGMGEVFCAERIPVGIAVRDGKPDFDMLKSWWMHRSIPISRSGIRKALEVLEMQTSQELLTKCMGLSLSDQYWVRPHDSDLQWEDVNFFDNEFSENVGNILFGERPNSGTLNMLSPEGASDGWLKKKWKIIDGKRCLVKGGSSFYQEPFNEVIAYRISKRLGIAHIPYTLSYEGKNRMPVSVCEDFVKRDTELIPAGFISKVLPMEQGENKYAHFVRCCEHLGVPRVQESLDEMLVLDYLIGNQDRHAGNFGVLRDVKTLTYLGFSPIYDCGTSLRYDTPTVYIEPDLDIESQPFLHFHNEQIQFVQHPEVFDLKKLAGIEEEIAEIFNDDRAVAYIDAARQEKILAVITKRIQMLTEILEQQPWETEELEQGMKME